MNSRLCDELGIEFPLFAFSHCRDVIAAVTNAGGFGVLGAAGHSPATLDIELNWIDEQVGGKSYGVDLLVPTSMDSKEHALTARELEDRIPEEHKRYIAELLARHDIDTGDLWDNSNKLAQSDHPGARQLVNYYVGQGVGLMNETVSARTVVYNFMQDFADAAERLADAVGE
ncbi:MAG: hypothetical protein OXU77_06290 [Gammaproteobacteria bacterium]|nr:hypothetical protein [Gammaproteobacteria bacterium]MDE0441168.1 hypothetical protein [Gammaproteobacteria bacterium]